MIWQKSMDLTDLVFQYIKDLPKEERYNLCSQVNRSACSIPANIAEGCGKRSNIQFAEFLSISLSSSYELDTHLIICERRKYGNQELVKKIFNLLSELQKMIFSFRETVLMEGSKLI